MDMLFVCGFVRVLQLMQLRDSRLPLGSCSGEKLELALLSFFEQFRKIYVGDQVPKTSKVSCKHISSGTGFEKTALCIFSYAGVQAAF